MPHAHESVFVALELRKRPLALAVALTGALIGTGVAEAAPAVSPAVPPGFAIRKLASVPTGVTNCDDLTGLDGQLFVTCQNGTQSAGGGGSSTIVEYSHDGALLNQWTLADKADGIGADPTNHRLIVTLNEDANTHLATITPSAAAGQQVVPYKYSVDPGSRTLMGALHTGGGTDSVIVDARGQVYIAASFGQAKMGTAVFKTTLTAPSTPTGTGTATLVPTFKDNASATDGNAASGTVAMKLVDVDSNAIVPYSSPRFGGQLVIDDQTSLQLVFASNIDSGTGLTALKTKAGLDDIRWATSDGGTLYIVDKGSTDGMSALYKVTGPFVAGTAYASNDGSSDQVVTVNLTNGGLTPFVTHLKTAKGLVFADAGGAVPSLPLASATATASATGSGAQGAGSGTAAKPASSSSDSDALPVVLAVLALLLGALAAALSLRRRPQAARSA